MSTQFKYFLVGIKHAKYSQFELTLTACIMNYPKDIIKLKFLYNLI